MKQMHSKIEQSISIHDTIPSQLVISEDIVLILINLLNSLETKDVNVHSSNHVVKVGSLSIEHLASVDQNIFSDGDVINKLTQTLLNWSVKLQEVEWLSEAKFRLKPHPKFIWDLTFALLNRCIDIILEEKVLLIWTRLAKILVWIQNKSAGDLNDQIDEKVNINDSHNFALLLDLIGKYLMKHVNIWHSWNIMGLSATIYNKANLMSILMALIKATTDQWKPIAQKAFID